MAVGGARALRVARVVSLSVLVSACGGDSGSTSGHISGGSLGETTDGDGTTGGSESTSSDAESSESTGNEVVCEPLSPPIQGWIGGPCEHDDDCGYDGGFCLVEEEGFPCGTCTLPCDMLCPDLDGTPETFCADATDLALAPPEGLCISRCDPLLFEGNGCRDGYACAVLGRWMEPATQTGVCIPEALAPEAGDCLEQLTEMGISYEPYDLPPEAPEGHPNLLCEVIDPILLYGPVNGVDFRYASQMAPAPIVVSCELALAMIEATEVLGTMGAVELQHLGTYNCRVIANTNDISMHGLGIAIDLSGFTLDDDTQYTVLDDWEDNVQNPVTPGGQWLKTFTDTAWDMMIFHIILTPNYNAAHDNHFHVDLKPGSMFYE